MLSPLPRRRFFVLPIGLIVLGGCRLPWSSEKSVPEIHTAATGPAVAADVTTTAAVVPANAAQPKQSATKAYQLPAPEPSQEEAMAEVLADLEEIGAIDPAAREALMEDLRAAKLSNWPLIVQSFRAALAYREQLIERDSGRSVLAKAQPGTSSSESAEPGSLERPRESTPATRMAAREIAHDKPTGDRSAQIAPNTSLPEAETQPSGARLSVENPLRDASKQTPDVSPTAAEADKRREPVVRGEPPSRISAGGSEAAARFSESQKAPSPKPSSENSGGEFELGSSPSPDDRGEGSGSADAAVQPAAHVAAVSTRPNDPFETLLTEASRQGVGADISRLPPSQSWQEELSVVIRQLEAATTNAPATGNEVRTHALLRMLYLVADRRDDALRPIPGIAPAQQDYWSRQLFALSTYLDENGPTDARRRATAAQTQLAEAVAFLGELGSLSVHNLTFCSDVSGFGVYTPIRQPHFVPGERVLLYVEVRNYRSVSTENGYHTVLATSYAVLDEQGQRVAGGDFPEVEDDCKNRRRDFHIQYGVLMPSHLHAGNYSIELVIQDVLGNKIGRSRTDFEISSQ